MADSNQQIFQFTLGPVQGFVAQARRTRDFWAGSFILSWLSSVAIESITRQGGTVEFPVPDEDYMRHLRLGKAATGNRPQQGSIPNRFLATTATVPAGFHPEWVAQAVQAAWQALARAVWDGDLAHLTGKPTETIWQRQIASLWEISWVLSDGRQPSLLDRRKNWRSPVLPDEPGHKCMVMDGWQELSGVQRTSMAEVNAFWQKLARGTATGLVSDLGDAGQDHLCALAYIKRRFSRYFDGVRIALPGSGGEVGGWHVPSAVPSVAFVAAAPWLAQAIVRAPKAFEDFHTAARELVSHSEAAHVGAGSGAQTDFEIDIACVKQAAGADPGFKRLWAGLDGQVYFDSALDNHARIFGPGKAQAARHTQQALRRLVDAAGVGRPSPYYAIVRMDGDQLGKHMGEQGKQTPISRALNQFTHAAGDIVRKHNGFLIYAGGDDVLALLPLPDALPAAAALQQTYVEAFAAQQWPGEAVLSTLSGAVQFVHFRTPLTQVLQDSHQLLDKVAKDETGRNAIAVRVWKPSGMVLQWAMPWERALDADGTVRVMRLADAFARQADAAQETARFSSKFFFRMESLLERFSGMPQEVLEKLLLAEYLHSFDGQRKATAQDQEALKQHLAGLLDQCWRYQRAQAGAPAKLDPGKPLNPDAALLVRFLAHKGLERD